MSAIKNLLYDYMDETDNFDYTHFTEKDFIKFQIKYLTVPINAPNKLMIDFFDSVLPQRNNLQRWLMIICQGGCINYKYNTTRDFVNACATVSTLPVNDFFSAAVYDNWYVAENARYSNVIFLDIDGIDDADLINMDSSAISDWLMNKYNVPEALLPNWVVCSGHGLHLYFIVDEIDFKDHEQSRLRDYYTKMLICYFKADRICKNKNHILRLPLSYNCKKRAVQTRLHHLNNSHDTNISRLEFFYCSDEDIIAYDNECSQKQKDHANKNTLKDVRTKKRIKEHTTNIVDYSSLKFCVPPNSLKYFDDFRRNARYSNTIKDLHNYYVRHKGRINGQRNIFIHILATFLRMTQLPLNEAIDYIEPYCTTDFLAEAQSVVKSVYEKEKIYHYSNDTIAFLLNFTPADHNNSYCCYSDKERAARRKESNRRAKAKQYKDARAKKKEFKDNLHNFISENLDMSSSSIATQYSISIRTIQRIKKQIRDSIKTS